MGNYFHGTNVENVLNIISKGFNTDNKVWNLSEDDKVYFWNVNEYRNEQDCLGEAYVNACKASAVRNSKHKYTAVLEFIGDVQTDPDLSCDIAPWETRICISTDVINEKILEDMNCIRIYLFRYEPASRAKYLYPNFHNCGGTNWNNIKDSVVDIESLLTDLRKLEMNNEYECFFLDLYKLPIQMMEAPVHVSQDEVDSTVSVWSNLYTVAEECDKLSNALKNVDTVEKEKR